MKTTTSRLGWKRSDTGDAIGVVAWMIAFGLLALLIFGCSDPTAPKLECKRRPAQVVVIGKPNQTIKAYWSDTVCAVR